MIIELLINVITSTLNYILSLINMPDLPETFINALDTVIEYLVQGIPIIYYVYGQAYTQALFGASLALFTLLPLWKMLNFILKKLPIGWT